MPCAGVLSRAAYELTGDRDNYMLVGHIENAILAVSGQQRFSLPLVNDCHGYEPIQVGFGGPQNRQPVRQGLLGC